MPEWDASSYHRLSEPQFSWGSPIVAALELRGDETILDAGCGSGRLTALLLERLPQGRVVALDSSANMLREAAAHLEPRFGKRVSFAPHSLLELPFDGEFDGIVSTATFHWVPDHDRLFANLFRALKPGGWLVAQCGGGPNLQHTRSQAMEAARLPEFAPYFKDFREPWNFTSAEETAERLRRAGFADVSVTLQEAPVLHPTAERIRDHFRVITLHRHVACLPTPELQERYLDAIVALSAKDDPPYRMDYWRLNIRAIRPE